MQSQSLRTCPSKAFSLYASIEWGLSGVRTLSPFSFEGSKAGRLMSFHCSLQDSENYQVTIPNFEEEFLLLSIANKQGDNCVVLTREDCKPSMGGSVDFHWLAKHLKRKFDVQYTPSPNIFPDAGHSHEEG